MNSQTAVERALKLITPPPTGQSLVEWRTKLNVMVNDARYEFADQNASSGDRDLRELTRKTFPDVTSDAAGYSPLTALLTAEEPLLVKHFNCCEIYAGTNKRRVTLLPDESAVRLDRIAGFPFGTLVGDKLLIFNGGQPYAGPVSIRGPFIPSLATIVGQLEEPYVIVLHAMATRQTPSPARNQVKDLKTVTAEGK